MKMARLLPICSLLICSAGVTTLIVSVATDYWRSSIVYEDLKIRDGLFRYCMISKSLKINECGKKDYGDLPRE